MSRRRRAPGDPLTSRQHAVVAAYERLRAELGYPPTRVQLAQALGCAATTLAAHLAALEAKGVFVVRRGAARGLLLRPHVENGV